jgi:hypothetical protein
MAIISARKFLRNASAPAIASSRIRSAPRPLEPLGMNPPERTRLCQNHSLTTRAFRSKVLDAAIPFFRQPGRSGSVYIRKRFRRRSVLVLALRGVHTRLRPFKMVSRIVSLHCKSAHLEISPALSARCPQGFRVRATRADAADRSSVTHFRTPRKYAFQQNVFQLAGLFCDRGRPSGTLSSASAAESRALPVRIDLCSAPASQRGEK